MNGVFREKQKPLLFGAIKIRLASPDTIKNWSHGEVRKPETINYRTFKPERDGLFCARIFGPIRDYECLCGKYKRMKHAGIVCEKCGVEVIKSSVRRERMGHIELAAPVAHIWFMRSLPSRIGTLLDISLKDLERVLYFETWIVMDPGQTDLAPVQLLEDEELIEAREKFGENSFVAGIGGEAIYQMLKGLQLDTLSVQMRSELGTTGSKAKRKKIAKRMRIVEAFRESQNDPSWMVHTVIPVVPPELRPLVPLDGGRFATSDVNDLYRRVINRNNRLKRLIELNAPDIIIRNEKRMLQEAVDALYDNGRHGRSVTGPNRRPLKSLSDLLKGKQGRFRQNLLGKRVDYSGRSVIVVGPELKLHQCGLPKIMALELFKPFIYHKLMQLEIANSIKSAKKLVEKQTSEVWDVLDDVIKEHPVILNRAPTLHRLGMQAFEPVLIEGKAIRLHPLVCTAFNADFDGDQMAVHVPLSLEAQIEARVLMMSTNNILSPANGKPIIVPTQDIVLGCYYMTRERPGARGEGSVFASTEEVRFAYETGVLALQARIQFRFNGKRYQTTAGRVLLQDVIPSEVPFELVNKVMDKKALGALIDYAFRRVGAKETVIMADKLRTMGYNQATAAGISISVNDMKIPGSKEKILNETRGKVAEIEGQYRKGAITWGEKYNRVIEEWQKANNKMKDEMMEGIGFETVKSDTGKSIKIPSFNNIYIMADSGARGSQEQMRQLAGMRGLMAKPSGEIIETPITSNFREGLNVQQYFISTHGARKGLADTALKTANSGYLTRKLVDVAQDCIVMTDDCGTIEGIEMTALVQSGEIVEPLGERILGRTALYDIVDPYSGRLIVEAGHEINEELVEEVDNAGVVSVWVRSVLTCRARYGICIKCYGRDLARGSLVNIGEAVGVIAAQSIGEPGTQLTMRTFHVGGAATRRVEQSGLEVRLGGRLMFKSVHSVIGSNGFPIVMNRNAEVAVVDAEGREREVYHVPYGAQMKAQEGAELQKGDKLAEWDPFSRPILTEVSGVVKYGDIIAGVTLEERRDEFTMMQENVIREAESGQNYKPRISVKDVHGKTIELADGQQARYFLPVGAILVAKEGETVKAGDVIAKTPRETIKTKDITGGLPRVSELFDARKPKDPANVTEIDGMVRFAPEAKGRRQIMVVPEVGESVTYAIPKGKHIIVHERDWVKAGDPLTEGSVDPHDILRVLGEKELASFLVDEIQEVYRLQGVKINDKHIEVIVRQMLRRVRVVDPGDTSLLPDEAVEKSRFEEINERALQKDLRPAVAEPLLLGITKASLSTESWISAASFQETTKVLTEAAIFGRVDHLRGLKENVIVGRLIPAGSGNVRYRRKRIVIQSTEPGAVDFHDEEETMATE